MEVALLHHLVASVRLSTDVYGSTSDHCHTDGDDTACSYTILLNDEQYGTATSTKDVKYKVT